MRPARRPTVGVVGLGLIGGSVARALADQGFRVLGWDRPRVRRQAERAGVVAAAVSLASLVRSVDVLVLAATPEANLGFLTRLADAPPGLVITDVSSVKGPICREAQRLGLRSFVGGHPMAGSEASGFAASSADLFRGRNWILVSEGADKGAVATVKSLVRSLGSKPVHLTASEHDRAMAFLSHGPQVASWALLEAARDDRVAGRLLDLAGTGFRDMTRLARSPRALWREILEQNRREVDRAVTAVCKGMARRERG